MRTLLVAAALALTTLVGAAAALEADSAAGFDFGDAPDGAPAGYAGKPTVVGTFPSEAASGGPRHDAAGPRVGRGWSAEGASRQVDRDADDGARVDARSCETSTLTLVLDASRVPDGTPVYVNAWFDWNQDGDWADGAAGSCGPEWGVQNYRVDTSTLDGDVVTLELRFRAGRVPDEFWWRVQVHTGSPVPHAAGGRQASPSPGETEDRLYSRPRVVAAERVAFRCEPVVAVMDHGSAFRLDAWLTGTVGRSIRIAKVEAQLLGDRDGVVLGRPRVRAGLSNAVAATLTSTKQHDRAQIAQVVDVQFAVTAAIEGRLRDYRSTCTVMIWHTARIVPPPIEQPTKTPAVTVPGSGAAIDPIRPDPAIAGCKADFVKSGQGADVTVRCDGLSPKLLTVSPGNSGLVRTLRGRRGLGSCGWAPDGRAMSCLFPRMAKGKAGTLSVLIDRPFVSFTVYVTAGGYNERGTTHVLRQEWWVTKEGVYLCSQYIPRTERQRCATIATSPRLVDGSP